MKKLFSILLGVCFCINATAQESVEGAPITVTILPTVGISGKPIEISGTTLVAKEPLTVSIIVTGPDNKSVKLQAVTDKKGNYKTTFKNTGATGKYTIKAIPADEKNQASGTFYVSTISGAVTDIQNDLFKATQSAQRAIEAVTQKIAEIPSTPEIEEKKTKLAEVKQKISELKTKHEEVSAALKVLVKEAQDVPEAAVKVNEYMADINKQNKELTDQLPAMDAKVQQFKNVSTSCEALNTIGELCGFASLVLDFERKAYKTFINLASDKVLPGAVDRMTIKGNDLSKESKKLAINTAQKTLVNVATKGYDLSDFIKTGLSLDLGQYFSKIIYAQFCEELKGKTSTTFKATFKSDGGEVYSVYDVELKGELKLRYAKNTDITKGAEITGEFIGYRVRYGFEEDFEKVEKVPDGMVLFARKTYTPLAADLNSINNDLGMFANSMVPGSYRVKVKGIVQNNTLKLEVIKSPSDYTEKEEKNNIWVVIMQPLLPIPIIKNFEVPIASNRIMFIAALKNKTFKLVKAKEVVTITDSYLSKMVPGDGILIETKMAMNISNKN